MHHSLTGDKICYLSDLYVYPEMRSKGLGRALMNQVIRFTQQENISNVRWLTQDNNYLGRKLYDSYQPKSDFILYSIPLE